MCLVSITARLAKDERGMELVEWAVFGGLMSALVLTVLLTFETALQNKCVAIGEFISAL